MKIHFSGVKILVRINSPGSPKGARYGFRLGPREKVYFLSPSLELYHTPGKSGAGGGSVPWDIMSLSERSAPPGGEPGYRVEEHYHEPKNYQKNGRGEQDAVRPER